MIGSNWSQVMYYANFLTFNIIIEKYMILNDKILWPSLEGVWSMLENNSLTPLFMLYFYLRVHFVNKILYINKIIIYISAKRCQRWIVMSKYHHPTGGPPLGSTLSTQLPTIPSQMSSTQIR